MILQISIITPGKVFWSDEADELILSTNTGQMGVLDNHAPLITALEVGIMIVRQKEEWTSFALMGGFALVKNNKIIVLANEADSAVTLDRVKVENAFLSAKQQKTDAQDQKQKVEANFAFKRARAQYQVFQQKQW